jgi:ABC-type nickel/cobalt efflux system permease component RcnA
MPGMYRWLTRALCLPAVAVGLALVPAGPAAAHPLGNFTVNTADRLVVTADGLEITHVVDYAEIPTVQLAQARTGADTSGDKVLSESELAAYAGRECTRLADVLEVVVDGSRADLTSTAATGRSAPGTAGLPTTRVECTYTTDVRPRSTVEFVDPAAGERNGWREVTASSRCGALPESSVPAQSISGLLTNYPVDLLSSPSDVTTATFSVRAGAACASGSVGGGGATEDEVAPRGLDRVSRFFTDFLGRPDLTLPFAVVSIAASVLFGVLHALAPGHGKTVMAAYLVGQRGTRRQALQLGAVVTFTHTISVLLLGAVLAAGALAAPELVVPFTEVLSGVLLAIVGIYLLVLALRRLRAVPDHEHGKHGHSEHGHSEHGHAEHSGHPHDHASHEEHDHGGHTHSHADHGHEHPHGKHGHGDHDGHEHPHPQPERELVGAVQIGGTPAGTAPAGGGLAVGATPLVHSHGGRAHSHAPLPEGPLNWKTLAGMGVAGGLVPSPSALLVLLSATLLGRAWFGVLLVVFYGLGMAITLTLAGLLLLRARAALDRRGWSAGRGRRFARLLPLGTAGIVVLVGLALVLRGLLSGRGLL